MLDFSNNNNALHELFRECGIVLFDSAMGTSLISLDLPARVRSEAVNALDPEAVKTIHRANIAAGADVITTNTFGISSVLAGEARGGDFAGGLELLRAGVACARSAAEGSSGGHIKVALDIGPTGRIVELSDDLTHEEAIRVFAAQAEAGEAAGADLILIETMTDLAELEDALTAAKAACALPALCTMTFEESGRSFMGADPVSFARAAEALGAAAVGVNCTLAPKEIAGIVRAIAGEASLPVIVQPNAGRPVMIGGKQIFEMDPSVFAADAAALADAGAALIGGCCGTTPEMIALLSDILTEGGKRKKRRPQ
ncbi:MAG: homocysteine S-methyltransferase family protein [Clostridiales Family XIII bacterium]|jgi:5-methyltetrahydrofolate--homocysteine methyltransferase|nr:homocysteine S-methyltransferase family protein [Clostridiales Family XIII bacterium]